MRRLLRWSSIAFLCCLVSVWADQSFKPSRSAEAAVTAGVQAVFDVVHKYSGKDYETIRQSYLDDVTKALDPFIGYAVITRRVMGETFDTATREQKLRFLQTFKRSLINTYAGGLFAFGDFKVKVLPSQDDKKDTWKNTRVYLEVIDPQGPKYSMVQSVYYSRSANDWKMQNVIFNGINLGVTFRTQFEELYKKTGNNLDKTIDEWERITEESYSSQYKKES